VLRIWRLIYTPPKKNRLQTVRCFEVPHLNVRSFKNLEVNDMGNLLKYIQPVLAQITAESLVETVASIAGVRAAFGTVATTSPDLAASVAA